MHLRETLRKAASRQEKSSKDEHTSAESHTSYHNLTSGEKDIRLRNMHDSLTTVKQRNRVLENEVAHLIEQKGIQLDRDDCNDALSLISEVDPIVKSTFPSNSPQKIFWDQQVLYNNAKDKRQMRWHPLVIRFALNLKYLSTSAYKALRQSGIIHLPSERTLSDYTHWSTPNTGVSLEFVEEFVKMMDDVSCGQRQCTVSMDEMTIKSGLVFDKQKGTLVGFIDLGGANRDIELLLNGRDESNKQLADHVLVFMARAVFKPTLSLPVAHYFSLNIKGMCNYMR